MFEITKTFIMKKIILLSLCCMFCKFDFAQKNQSIFFEIFGPGLASFNYDVRFSNAVNNSAGMRLGIGGWSTSSETVLTFPMGINYLAGGEDGKHFLELGANLTFVSFNQKSSSYYGSSSSKYAETYGTLNIGYRSQPIKNGFQFRVSLNPIITNGEFYPFYFGISFGYKF